MTDKVRCNGAPECAAPYCGRFEPHEPHEWLCSSVVCRGASRDCVPVEQLMICPDAATCKDKSKYCGRSHATNHGKPHERNKGCGRGIYCPACVPCEPEPEPQPVDLDTIRNTSPTYLIGEAAMLQMCDEIERLRQIRKRLYSEWFEACQERDKWIETVKVQNDKIVRLRKDRNAALAESDRKTELAAKEHTVLIGQRDTARGERNDAIVEIANLRQRLATASLLHCAGDDDPDARELLPDVVCNQAKECTNMECPACEPHKPGTHPRCGEFGFCGWFRDAARCEVSE